MVYVYSCPVCPDYNREVRKTVKDRHTIEFCEKKHEMPMVIRWQGQMKLGDIGFKPHYNPAFGRVFTSPGQERDAVRQEKYENGVELVNIGTDRPYKETPKKAEIDWDAAGRELNQRLKRG